MSVLSTGFAGPLLGLAARKRWRWIPQGRSVVGRELHSAGPKRNLCSHVVEHQNDSYLPRPPGIVATNLVILHLKNCRVLEGLWDQAVITSCLFK